MKNLNELYKKRPAPRAPRGRGVTVKQQSIKPLCASCTQRFNVRGKIKVL